jgi:hypothetical protein
MNPVALNFYHNNKNIKSRLPKLPENVSSDFEVADWLLNKSEFGWLELDINVDVSSWIKEAEDSKTHLVPHRESDSHGWNSCCIHGIDPSSTGAWTSYGYTQEDQVPYHWTSVSSKTPAIKKFWQEFPYDSYRRIRFMELEAGGHISPHSDAPGRLPGEENFDALKFGVPINVALVHPEECYMSLDGHGCVPFEPGKAFIINIRNYHSVINLSNTPRIHLIAHGKLENKVNRFCELVARSYRKQYDAQS